MRIAKHKQMSASGGACRPLKVLFLGAANGPGGVLGYINSIVENVNSSEFEFHALCSDASNACWFSKRIKLHEFNCLYGVFDFFWQTYKLRKLLKVIDPDIIHLHTARAGFQGILSNFRILKPVVYSGHAWRFEQKENFISREIFLRIERFISKKADVVTFLTNRDLQQGVSKSLVEKRKSVAINTRIQAVKVEDIGTEIISDVAYFADQITVLNIGEVCERKNPMLFIEIAKRVISMRSDVRFEWLGEGVLREQVQQRVKEWGLSHAISFPGALDNVAVRSRISAAKVLLFTSHYEGVPLVVLEAKLGNLPVVAGNYPGVEAVVRHGLDGFVFDLYDPDAGAQHVITLLNNSEIHTRFTQVGREFAIVEHSRPEVMAGEFATVYRGLVGAGQCVPR